MPREPSSRKICRHQVAQRVVDVGGAIAGDRRIEQVAAAGWTVWRLHGWARGVVTKADPPVVPGTIPTLRPASLRARPRDADRVMHGRIVGAVDRVPDRRALRGRSAELRCQRHRFIHGEHHVLDVDGAVMGQPVITGIPTATWAHEVGVSPRAIGVGSEGARWRAACPVARFRDYLGLCGPQAVRRNQVAGGGNAPARETARVCSWRGNAAAGVLSRRLRACGGSS